MRDSIYRRLLKGAIQSGFDCLTLAIAEKELASLIADLKSERSAKAAAPAGAARPAD